MHLYPELLWAALGRAPARIRGDPLAEHILPWQVAEWALRERDRLRKVIIDGERSAPLRGLSWIGRIMTVTFVWLFGLGVIAMFWWFSMPAHDDRMTVGIGLLFALALWTARQSWRQSQRYLDGHWPIVQLMDQLQQVRRWIEGRSELHWRSSYRWAVQYVRLAMLVAGLVAISLARTASDLWPARWQTDFLQVERSPQDWFALFSILSMARADLVAARIAAQPVDWANRDEAERDFRALWARREGLPYRDPLDQIEARDPETEFSRAYDSHRATSSASGIAKPMADEALSERSFRLQWAKARRALMDSGFPA